MNVIPQMLENQVALLKKCVEFYADENNYKITNKNTKSVIDNDKGYVAKEILKSIQSLEKQNQDISDQYDALVNEANANPDNLLAEVKKMIDEAEK